MSRKVFEDALAWWERQFPNYRVVKTALCDFPNGFCEVFWENGEEHGRDRIRKSGSEFVLEVIA